MSLWNSIKHVVGGVGDVAKKAAPFATFIPGVGPLAAAGLGGLGALAGELNDADGFQPLHALSGAAIGGAGAYGLDKLGGLAGAVRGGAAAAPGASAGGGGGGSLLGRLGSALGVTKPGGGLNLGTLGALGLGAAGLYDAHKQSGRQEDLLREQLGLAREQAGRERELFQAGAPIRSAAAGQVLSRIQAGAPAAPDLSGLADVANPFRERFRTPALVPAPRRSA